MILKERGRVFVGQGAHPCLAAHTEKEVGA